MMQPPHFFFGITWAKRVRLNRFRIVIGVFLASIFCLSAYKLITGLLSANREQAAFAELSAIVSENRAVAEVQTSQPSLPSQKPAAGSVEVELVPSETALHAPESDSEPVSLLQYLHLYERNPDFFGWLSIEGTEIDYPVMYTPDETEYYLHRAFDGSYSNSGVPFLDGNCAADGNYYLIYGHHMKNETMFGQLPRYANKDFWEDHPVIRFDTLYERHEYIVMTAFLSRIYDKNEQGIFRYYEYFDLSDEAIFGEYIQQVKAAALYDTGITAEYGNELLVLSTCNYHTADGRFVVVSKRIT